MQRHASSLHRPPGRNPVDLVSLPLAHRNDEYEEIPVTHLVDQPETCAAQFDLVSLLRAVKSGRRNLWVAQALGELGLILIPHGRIESAPFLQRFVEEGEFIAHRA